MRGFLRSKLAIGLAAFVMLAASIIIPLSGSIKHTFAASRTSHNIAYVNYDDSGFSAFSANIFATSIVGGPAQTSSPATPVAYNGMTFTPLPRAALSTATLAPFDTLILFEVCDIATSLSASQHSAINAYLAAGNKILLYDGDRCAPGQGGTPDYSWFMFPFATSNPGPQGATGTLNVVENSTLTQGLSSDPFNADELGDANTATSSDPHWFAAAKTTNALGNNGFFLAYARNAGLIIYDGADHWATDGPTKSLTDLFLNELNQVYDPDNLPGTIPLASPTPSLTPPTVTPTPGTGPKFTPKQKAAFKKLADETFTDSVALGVLAAACAFIPAFPVNAACGVALAAQAGALAIASRRLDQLYADAPDPNFKTIYVVRFVPSPPVGTAQGFTRSEADALNALSNAQLKEFLLEGGLLVSIDRAQGAAVAGNSVWEARQLQMARSYADQAGEILASEPGLLANVEHAFENSGFPGVHVKGTGDFPEILDNKSLIAAMQQAAEALEQFAKD